MRHLTLILSLVALIGAVASGVLFFIIGDTKQKLHQQLVAEQARASGLAAELTAAEVTRTEQQERIRSLDAQLAATKRELTATQVQADQIRQALDLAEEQFAAAEITAARARADLVAAQTELVSARKAVANSIAPADAMRYRNTIANLETRVMELETVIEQKSRETLMVSNRANHAQVVSVGAQNAFVVINFGSTHGAVPNQQFQIKRGPDVLAVVEISATRENYSIAQVLPASLSGKLRKGDAATLTL
ncbi:hypothetical protein [Synoicihabitans lomoniglobus]|uniref:Uncharacterized protein n=1 Tax=Synoicihabitans lomoniglobus TaxID=2909285 RepID=A0AAF0I5G5_9BACT|nr:hypothetical protein [Opitutaceae bacterium LMO-M01]WED67035.1 hypothetical protein PXH66_09250 [Opitutaceae bacterium LMO-M01]